MYNTHILNLSFTYGSDDSAGKVDSSTKVPATFLVDVGGQAAILEGRDSLLQK